MAYRKAEGAHLEELESGISIVSVTKVRAGTGGKCRETTFVDGSMIDLNRGRERGV